MKVNVYIDLVIVITRYAILKNLCIPISFILHFSNQVFFGFFVFVIFEFTGPENAIPSTWFHAF